MTIGLSVKNCVTWLTPIVGEAEDGARACELSQQLQPDVILMDINMPRINGIEAIRWIKTMLP